MKPIKNFNRRYIRSHYKPGNRVVNRQTLSDMRRPLLSNSEQVNSSELNRWLAAYSRGKTILCGCYVKFFFFFFFLMALAEKPFEGENYYYGSRDSSLELEACFCENCAIQWDQDRADRESYKE